MVMAWSITEVIRYTNYALALLNIKSAPLEWLRYTLFYILYPIGAGSEAMHIFASAKFVGKRYGDWAQAGMLIVAIAIWPAGELRFSFFSVQIISMTLLLSALLVLM